MACLTLPVRCRLTHFNIAEIVKFLIALSLGYVMRITLEKEKVCPACICPVQKEVQTVVKPCEKQLLASDIEIINSFKPRNMYEVIRYDYFKRKDVWNNFDDDPRIGLPGFYKKNVKDILSQAQRLISNGETNKWKIVDLYNGYTRYDPLRGAEYILDLKLNSKPVAGSERTETYRLELLKPFSKAKLISSTLIDDSKTVHFILPLSGAGSRFEMFIQHFTKICINNKENVELFIVLFVGDTAEKQRKALEVSDRIKVLSANYPNAQIKVLKSNQQFTRALGLDIAAKKLPKDALLFFCDVDVTFTTDFLTRCRHNAVLGKQVFYPVVFAQYDPDIVRNFSPDANKEDLYDINKYTGHWVYYGFGMACMYNADYASVGGFDLGISGWGGEDVDLYTKHVKSHLQVMRAMDPSLIHHYHHKACDPKLTPDQFRMCVNSVGEGYGSKQQLAKKILMSQKDVKNPPA